MFFSESSHTAYQINKYGAYSNTQAHNLSLPTPSTCGWGKIVNKTILSVVMLHIKLEGKKYSLR